MKQDPDLVELQKNVSKVLDRRICLLILFQPNLYVWFGHGRCVLAFPIVRFCLKQTRQ